MLLLNSTQFDHLNLHHKVPPVVLVFSLTFGLALFLTHSILYHLTQHTIHLFIIFIYFFVCFISYPQDFKLHGGRNISFIFYYYLCMPNAQSRFVIIFFLSPIVSAQYIYYIYNGIEHYVQKFMEEWPCNSLETSSGLELREHLSLNVKIGERSLLKTMQRLFWLIGQM